MRFIVDTNIVFAGLLKDSVTRKILIDSVFELYAPEKIVEEIRKYEGLILEKSGLSKEDFEILFNLLIGNVQLVKKESYSEKLQEADSLIGNLDKGDVPFLALALTTPNDGIWSDDEHFQKQSRVKTWKTSEVLRLI